MSTPLLKNHIKSTLLAPYSNGTNLGEYAKIFEHILLVATLCLNDTKHCIL